MSPHLAPIEHPPGLRMKLLYRLLGKALGKPPSWLTVQSVRMPFPFLSWMGKVYKLTKRLELSQDTMRLVRARVDSINMCTWCQDAGRWYVMTKEPALLSKIDAIDDYRTSPLFNEKERAALDYATELTEDKHVSAGTVAALKRHYGEREICELSWVVATSHLFNINNLGLGIGSDGLCALAQRPDPELDRAPR